MAALGWMMRLVELLHFALGAEAWMPPVMPEDYHKYGIVFDII